MFESIRGILRDKSPHTAVVEINGLSYRLTIPLSTYTHLPHTETTVLLFLSQVIREDAHTLYAFLQKEERDLFETLITLSGVGPKTALALIGHMDIRLFHNAIAAADIRLLSKIPGIGKKTAERLVIEMRDKLKGLSKTGKPLAPAAGSGLEADAISALMNLGYGPLDAQKAIGAVLKEKSGLDLGQVITFALQKM